MSCYNVGLFTKNACTPLSAYYTACAQRPLSERGLAPRSGGWGIASLHPAHPKAASTQDRLSPKEQNTLLIEIL